MKWPGEVKTMSFKDGMAAICLEMPDKVPRTEYSADFHWELVSKVTGMRWIPKVHLKSKIVPLLHSAGNGIMGLYGIPL